jgi:hypothetical protein
MQSLVVGKGKKYNDLCRYPNPSILLSTTAFLETKKVKVVVEVPKKTKNVELPRSILSLPLIR